MNLKNVCSRKKIKMLMAVVVSVMTICLFFSEKVANIQIPNINFILMLVSKVHMFHLREEKNGYFKSVYNV